MNKPKKPAVIAKTAPKKRGRPAGVKNKPKTVSFQAKPMFSDWEKLAKQLQAALAAEIQDNDLQQEVIDSLNEELNRSRTFFERLVCLVTGRV